MKHLLSKVLQYAEDFGVSLPEAIHKVLEQENISAEDRPAVEEYILRITKYIKSRSKPLDSGIDLFKDPRHKYN